MAKTPYEIRAELLQMASDHLREQYFTNLEFSRKLLDKAFEQINLSNLPMTPEEMKLWAEDMQKQLQTILPAVPSMEDIMKRATEFYSFVNKKD
jgi:hypothetical protein